jgi:hypothetical protein
MRPRILGSLLVVALGVLLGSRATAGEDDIRQLFVQLQKAIKAHDADKIWDLIDDSSQTAATRSGKLVQAGYAKTSDKAGFEKRYGLTSTDLTAMTGKLFLKSKRFFDGKYDEVPGSKLLTVTVKGDTAKLTYLEEDGDKEKFSLVREKGRWKFVVPMPRAGE